MSSRVQAQRWGTSLAVAVGLHALPVLAALWWLASAQVPVAPAAAPIVIELAPLPVAPPAPPRETPPGPEQLQTDAPKPPPTKPRPEIKAEEPALPEPEPTPPAPREEREPAPQTTAPPAAPAPPDEAPAAPASGANSSAAAVPRWQGEVLGHLDRHKTYPPAARRQRQQGVPYVRFALDREGRVLYVRLEQSSGIAALDEEAVALPTRAQPFPKPPAEVPGEAIELVVPVEFYIR